MVNKKMMKRLSALLLTATLCISACPTNVAYATEVTETTVETTVEDTQTEQMGTEEQNVVAASEEEDMSSEVETVEETGELTGSDIIPNDETGIPDAALYQSLLDEVKNDTDGKLSVEEALNISWLDIYLPSEDETRVQSFKNLSKYVPNLTSFVCYDYIKEGEKTTLSTADIEEFAKLENFNSMTLDEVLLENPEDLVKLNKLQGIHVTRSNITNVDFITKENFPNCTSITLYDNSIEKLPATIAEMENLNYLDVSRCGLKELPDISGLENMKVLRISNNELTSLPDLTKMGVLEAEASYFYGNILTEEEIRTKLPAHITSEEEYIKELVNDQKKEIECQISVDKTKATADDVITVTVTLTNKGVALNNVILELYAGWEKFLPEGEYLAEENAVLIETLPVGEEIVYTYKFAAADVAKFASPTLKFQAYAQVKDNSSIWANVNSEEVEVEGAASDGSGSGDSGYYESLDLTIKEVTVSSNNIVVNNDTPYVNVDVSVAVEGPDVDKLENGMYLIATINGIDTSTGLSADRQLVYNAATKRFEGTIGVGGNTWKDGAHSIKAFALSTSYMWMEIPCETEFPLWTYTNNTTDKTSPVLNGVQVLINGVTQTSSTFALKQGDTITIRADITDDSRVDAVALLYPANWDTLTTSQYMEMSNAGNLRLNMRATEYDLEAVKTLIAPFYAGEYKLYYISMSDAYSNGCTYFAEDIALLMKEVAKNPSNAGLVKNETLATELNKVASNIASLVAKEGAMDADVKAAVEAAIARGETISVDLTVSSVPASSINSKEREDIQKKADGVFGEATKLAFLDINMNILANGVNLGNLLEVGEEISITVTLPQELQGDYYYKVIRYHEKADGTVETSILDATKNADGTLTFKTDRFSTYAIAYSTNAPIGESPKTVDMEMTVLLLTLALSAMTAVVVSKKMRKTA